MSMIRPRARVPLLLATLACVIHPRAVVALVNGPPSIVLPPPVVTSEDAAIGIAGIVVSDPEDDILLVSIASPDGAVVPSFIEGTPGDVNAALGQLVFTPSADYSGSTFIDVFVDDGLNMTQNQLPVDVSPAPPEIIVPAGPLNLTEDIPLEITEFALQNVDGQILVGFASPDGTLAPDFLVGEAADVQQSLASVVFTPNPDFSGTSYIEIHVEDGVHIVDRQYFFDVSPAPPQVNTPSLVAGVSNQDLAIGVISLTDADGIIRIDLIPEIGVITPSTISGSASSVNQALTQLVYSPPVDFVGEVFLMISLDDGPHEVDAGLMIEIEASGGPAVPGLSPMGLAMAALAMTLLAISTRRTWGASATRLH